MEKLKPCPLCGAPVVRVIEHETRKGFYFVFCTACGARSGTFPKIAAAIKAWNERKEQDAEAQEQDEQ